MITGHMLVVAQRIISAVDGLSFGHKADQC